MLTYSQFMRRELKRRGARCDCGGPQYGTDHAPDCAFELAAEAAHVEWSQYKYETELLNDSK